MESEQPSGQFDLNLVAEVLADLIGRHRGTTVTIELTKKDEK